MNDEKANDIEDEKSGVDGSVKSQTRKAASDGETADSNGLNDQAEPPKDNPAAFDPPRERRGVGFGTVCVMSLLAALIGVGGGAALTPVIGPYLPWQDASAIVSDTEDVKASHTAIKAQLAKLEARTETSFSAEDIETLKARITALEARPVVTETGITMDPDVEARLTALETAAPSETAPSGQPSVLPVDLSGVETRIAALEDQISKFGSEEPMSTDPEVMARLEALEAEGREPSVPTTDPAVLERLTDLENREIPVLPDPVDLSPLQGRLSDLEANLSALKAEFEQAVAERDAIPLPTFPRDEIIAAISTDTNDKGWLGRVVNKHVRVRDTSLIQIVDEIEALVLQGDAKAALARIEDLPVEGRDAAKAWVEAVRIQRTSL